MESYPAVRFMVRHGRRLGPAVGLALPALALAGVLAAGWHWLWLPAALVAGAALGFAVRLFAELTEIIADMLLPQ